MAKLFSETFPNSKSSKMKQDKLKKVDVDTSDSEIKEVHLKYNNRSYQSYKKHGFTVPNEIDYQERNFLSMVNTEKDKGGPIEREITRMVRLKARDYSSKSKAATKEYLVYYENWYGKNWLGESIPPVADHVEGMFYEQDKTTIVDRDMRTGKTSTRYKRTGQHPEYYIEFSKKAVDDLLRDKDKESIIFTIKFRDGIRNNFSYDHLVNMSMVDAYKLNARAGGSSMNPLTAANVLRESGIS